MAVSSQKIRRLETRGGKSRKVYRWSKKESMEDGGKETGQRKDGPRGRRCLVMQRWGKARPRGSTTLKELIHGKGTRSVMRGRGREKDYRGDNWAEADSRKGKKAIKRASKSLQPCCKMIGDGNWRTPGERTRRKNDQGGRESPPARTNNEKKRAAERPPARSGPKKEGK